MTHEVSQALQAEELAAAPEDEASQAMQAEELAAAQDAPPAFEDRQEAGITDDEDDVSIVGVDIAGPSPSNLGVPIPAMAVPCETTTPTKPKSYEVASPPGSTQRVHTPTPCRSRAPGPGNDEEPVASPGTGRLKRKRPTPTPKKPPAPVDDDALDMPDVKDTSAKRPQVGKPTLSPAAIRMRSQRIFQRRANGSLKVSETIYTEWKEKGARRTMLESIFQQCGYDPVSYLQIPCKNSN